MPAGVAVPRQPAQAAFATPMAPQHAGIHVAALPSSIPGSVPTQPMIPLHMDMMGHHVQAPAQMAHYYAPPPHGTPMHYMHVPPGA